MKELLDYIKILSKQDKKNLSEKTLKTMEEVGELAKKVLPYENAPSTTHRFVSKKQILEEVADSLLCLLSIAYELNYSDEEIFHMMDLKSTKWADLLAREKRITYPIPYEIHITVEEAELETFKNACSEIGVKPILLDLHLQNNGVIKDLMTSSVFRGNNKEAFEETKRISNALEARGISVIREKIETIPWHPSAPSKSHENPVMPKDCYFESHLSVVCTDKTKNTLSKIIEKHGGKLSRNIFKKIDKESYSIMVTYRSYNSLFEDFKSNLENLKKDIINNGYVVDKEIIEFSIYDTKVSHDSAWINS